MERVSAQVRDRDYLEPIQEIFNELLKISKQIQAKRIFPFNLVLLGFMGAGKTSIGKELSGLLGIELVDLDELLEFKTGMSINELFENYGEAHFRGLETDLVKEVSQGENQIISCGGGVVLNQDNIEALKKTGRLIWLRARPETIYQRLQKDQARPLLKDHLKVPYIQRLLKERLPNYEKAADYIVDTDERPPSEIAQEIISIITNPPKED